MVDLQPIEPLPPLENALEMTQNHQEWVRSVEDFKLENKQMEELKKCVQVEALDHNE